MKMFEVNKIAGALLGSVLLLLMVNEIGNFVVNPVIPEKPSFVIETEEAEAKPAATVAAVAKPEDDLAALLAAGDAGKGAKVARKCVACHSFEKGGKNKIGPALYGVLGSAKASVAGFKFSPALTALGGNWSYRDMDAFLAKPRGFAKGTKMAFAGIKKAGDRANLIAFLRGKHDSAPALPAQ